MRRGILGLLREGLAEEELRHGKEGGLAAMEWRLDRSRIVVYRAGAVGDVVVLMTATHWLPTGVLHGRGDLGLGDSSNARMVRSDRDEGSSGRFQQQKLRPPLFTVTQRDCTVVQRDAMISGGINSRYVRAIYYATRIDIYQSPSGDTRVLQERARSLGKQITPGPASRKAMGA